MEINGAGPGASESEILIDRPFHDLHPAEKVFRSVADRRNIFQNQFKGTVIPDTGFDCLFCFSADQFLIHMADNKGRVGLPGEDIIASQLFGRSIDAAPGRNANFAKIGDFLDDIEPIG